MGKTVNSTLFRLETSSSWRSLYEEYNKTEIAYYLNQDLQIKEFVERFVEKCNFVLYDLKLRRSREKIELLIMYFKKPTSLKGNKKRNTLSSNDKLTLYTHRDFVRNLTESLLIALPKTLEVNTLIQCVNKNPNQLIYTRKHLKIFHAILFSLRRYNRDPDFSEFINLVLILVSKKCSAKVFTNILASKLTESKYHNKIFNFWQKALLICVESIFSKIKGVKLVISGRINGRPRSSVIKIIAGSVPNQTLMTGIDYSESTSFTKNGTLGVSVLVCTG